MYGVRETILTNLFSKILWTFLLIYLIKSKITFINFKNIIRELIDFKYSLPILLSLIVLNATPCNSYKFFVWFAIGTAIGIINVASLLVLNLDKLFNKDKRLNIL